MDFLYDKSQRENSKKKHIAHKKGKRRDRELILILILINFLLYDLIIKKKQILVIHNNKICVFLPEIKIIEVSDNKSINYNFLYVKWKKLR